MSKVSKAKPASASQAWQGPASSEPMTAWSEQALAAAAARKAPLALKAEEGFAISASVPASPYEVHLPVAKWERDVSSVTPLDHDDYIGNNNNNTVDASGYHDLYTFGGDDTVSVNFGQGGDMTIHHVDGGVETAAGRDVLNFRSSYSTTRFDLQVDLSLGEIKYLEFSGDYVVIVTFADIEELVITNKNVTVNGDDNANYVTAIAELAAIYGNGGDDVLIGSDNNPFASDRDYLNGGADNDYLYGRGGFDGLHGESGDDHLYGEDGFDFLYGGDGLDSLYGGTNSDWLYGENHDDRLYGDAGEDELHGGEGFDILYGGTENDLLYGEGGDDYLYGDAGNDLLFGGLGNDLVAGGAGHDIYYVNDEYGVLIDYSHLDLVSKTSKIISTTGDIIDVDTFNGSSIEQFIGFAYRDEMLGDFHANIFYGADGDDYLSGKAGADTLIGGAGRDYLYGGNDTSIDVFEFGHYDGYDVIWDFKSHDLLDISDFNYSDFSDLAGKISIRGNDTHIVLETENGVVVTKIVLESYTGVNAGDFIF